MGRSKPAIVRFSVPPNPSSSPVPTECWIQAAAEYQAALLAKLLRRIPQQELADTSSALLSELVALYRQAVSQAHGRAGRE